MADGTEMGHMHRDAAEFDRWYDRVMLPISLLVLLIASIYSIAKAPEELRTRAIIFMVVPPAIGFGIAYLLSGEDTRAYYGIAGAIGGWVIGANIYDSQRKKTLKAKESD